MIKTAWKIIIIMIVFLFPKFGMALAANKGLLIEVRRIVATEFYRKADRRNFGAADNYNPQRGNLLGDAIAIPRGYDDEIARELASLRASHTGRYTPDEIDYYELMDIYGQSGIAAKVKEIFEPDGKVRYPSVGVIPRAIDGKIFVAYVYDGSPAALAGILTGDEILSVDGEPYSQIASFKNKVGREVKFQIRRTPGSPIIDRIVKVVEIRPNDQLVDAIKSSARIVEKNGKSIGYVRLWAFSGSEVQTIVKELLTTGQLASADALVLDLRGRWGGAPPDAGELFVGRTANVTFIGPDGERTPVNFRWRKPVVALIDQGTRSGMEVLAYSLQKAGTPLIGSRTAGAVLGGRPFVLSDKSLLLVAAMDVRVDGKRLEGHGVLPDIPVVSSLPYSAGQDEQRERAFDEAAMRVSR